MKVLKCVYPIFTTVVLLLTISCTKVIDLKLGNESGTLVIEGNLTNIDGSQSVKLSRNVSFTTANTYPPVSGATVTINDQAGKTYKLNESAVAGTYTFNPLSGLAGQQYTLSVLTGSKTYTSSSTMPAAIALDSITAKNNVVRNNGTQEITVHYVDPAGISNQYLFLMYVNNVQVKAVFAINDQFSDGRIVNTVLRQDDIDVHSGDTVRIEMQCIDQPVYTYWFTLSQQTSNGPGGGVTPTNPPSNVSNGALGYFSAHTTQVKTIIVK